MSAEDEEDPFAEIEDFPDEPKLATALQQKFNTINPSSTSTTSTSSSSIANPTSNASSQPPATSNNRNMRLITVDQLSSFGIPTSNAGAGGNSGNIGNNEKNGNQDISPVNNPSILSNPTPNPSPTSIQNPHPNPIPLSNPPPVTSNNRNMKLVTVDQLSSFGIPTSNAGGNGNQNHADMNNLNNNLNNFNERPDAGMMRKGNLNININTKVGTSQSQRNSFNEDDEDVEDLVATSTPMLLKHRSISQTNFSGNWANMLQSNFLGKTSSPNSVQNVDSEENFDDIDIPENLAEITQKIDQNLKRHHDDDDDDFDKIEIPDDSYLSRDRLPARRQKGPNVVSVASSNATSPVSVMAPIAEHPKSVKVDVLSEDEVKELGAINHTQFTLVKKVHSDGRELDMLDIDRKKPEINNYTSLNFNFHNFTNKNNFTNPKPEKPKSTRIFDSVFGQKAVVSTEVYGCGTELDQIDDLPVPPQVSPPPVPKNVTESKKRKFHRPILIKNLNSNKKRHKVGNMEYDPVNMRWEGNWKALNVFDAPQTKKPGLIRPLNSTGVLSGKVNNNMVFNSKTLRWEGNEEESDIFENIKDLEESVDNEEEFFEPDAEFIKGLLDACEQHNKFLAPWTNGNFEHYLPNPNHVKFYEHTFLIKAIALGKIN